MAERDALVVAEDLIFAATRFTAKQAAEVIAQTLAEARAAGRVETLHAVNQVFCNGLASSLQLEFMRDMHSRVVHAAGVAEMTAERDAWRQRAEAAEAGIDLLNSAVDRLRKALRGPEPAP